MTIKFFKQSYLPLLLILSIVMLQSCGQVHEMMDINERIISLEITDFLTYLDTVLKLFISTFIWTIMGLGILYFFVGWDTATDIGFSIGLFYNWYWLVQYRDFGFLFILLIFVGFLGTTIIFQSFLGWLTLKCMLFYTGGKPELENNQNTQNKIRPQKGNPKPNKVYSEIVIGDQTWMQKNLFQINFRNGDRIPTVKSAEEWKNAGINGEPAYCYYEYRIDNAVVYGALYNWYAVIDSRGLAPEGWKIPTDGDWAQLIESLGGRTVAAKKMKSKKWWRSNEDENGNGYNENGFSALPSGHCGIDGSFGMKGKNCYFWSSTEGQHRLWPSEIGAWSWQIDNDNPIVLKNCFSKGFGYSVRCLKVK